MLFPSLKGQSSASVNLNENAIHWLDSHPEMVTDTKSPLLQPDACQQMVDEMHKRLGVVFSHGGYMEWRRGLWKGNYLEPTQKYMHLGVDFNVPPDTQVVAPYEAQVLHIDDDIESFGEGGWGPHIMMRLFEEKYDRLVLLIAHLSRDIRARVGKILEANVPFASVGKAPTNGNWFSHAHAQLITMETYKEHAKNGFVDLDGYCTKKEESDARKQYPDPMTILHVDRQDR